MLVHNIPINPITDKYSDKKLRKHGAFCLLASKHFCCVFVAFIPKRPQKAGFSWN